MFNLLRMDFYRIIRSKSVYVCLGLLLFMTALSFGLWFLMTSPQGQELAVKLGLGSAEMLAETAGQLGDVDFLALFRQTCLDGGMYNLIAGIWMMLFVCADFQSGFIKNVMAFHQNRWNYVGSKILSAAIVNACYLVLHLMAALALNGLLGGLVPGTGWRELAFYMSWAWLLTTAFSALILAICVLTRSVAAGAVGAVALGSGGLVMLVYGLLNTFHAGEWLEYSIYLTMSMGPGRFTSPGDLRVYGVGAGFLILYTVITGLFLRKRDI